MFLLLIQVVVPLLLLLVLAFRTRSLATKILQCGQVQVLLAHMREGSVAVRQGQSVQTGQKLGEVGASGNTATPHLHIHAQRPGSTDALFDANPLPVRIDGRYLVRGDRP